ncbi:VCBS repeat-containing protein [Mucilaginibacter sp. RS28]|uniref:VCBS repeat-containing protein n=1 Tax=Mucilaginibacter straminoryzae TaxID=2932774 RepID=A0A9X1X2U3_9SPHI|nr:VCBS repeat-containing protein [Mucilaginibacter straminoryzae]MCJ8209831.1 VCBS repeat-containing protein [Mucilaginibacter straminoryzae]
MRYSPIKRYLSYTFTLLILAASKQNSFAQQPLFRILPPEQTHVDFKNTIKENETLNVLSYEYFYNGGGVAVCDINNDGLEDLFFTSNMGQNKLYLNQGHLQFKDITRDASKLLEGRPGSWKTGVTMADVNGDGLLDIYICYSGKTDADKRRNQLFINNGDLTFTEKAKEYGLDDPGYSTQAAFFDFDNDGDLDMMLLNHNIKKIDNMELARYKAETDVYASNKLFRNDGNHFTDVSKSAGIIQNPLTFGLGLAIADVNKDGWPDIYVTNDYNEPDYLYINNHDGTFTEHSKDYFRHLSHFSMGVDIADFNNDALPDVLTLDMLPADNHRQKSLQLEENYESFDLMLNQGLYKQYMRNMLQLNNGNGTFSEIGQLAGIAATDWSWCPLIADFDNDGYKDIFISNGYLRDYTNKDFLRYWGDYKIKKAMAGEPFQLMDLVTAMPSTLLPNYIFKNNGDLTFSNHQKEWGINNAAVSSGAVYADLDNDGDLDLVVNNINESATIYQNTSRENNAGNYLALKLNGTGANKFAVGAKVTLYSKGKKQYQEVNPARGYLSCMPTDLTFGLGNEEKVDSIRIIWPGNQTQLLKNVKANQKLVLNYEPDSKPFVAAAPAIKALFTKVKPIIPYQPQPNNINDFKRQLLMLFMYSKTSPVILTADLNKDGLDDLFITGDQQSPGKIFLQQRDGTFQFSDLQGAAQKATVSAAAFFDANGDGYPDLYLAHGGYGLYDPSSPELQDELYINNGKGYFNLSNNLPSVNASSKSCVRPCDFDNDGDIDLFVGGRVIPGQYPSAPTSYLLVNNGKGGFTAVATPFANVGMVTGAQWIDLNKDGRKDLILCGETMPLKAYLNTTAGFVDKTTDYFGKDFSGFWSALTLADVDGDGNQDLIAGNLGLNTQLKATAEQPAELYYLDVDGNGSIDPFFNFYMDGKSYPFVSRDELNDQIYPMRRKFSSYKAYADATMKDILTPEQLQKAGKLTANTLTTTCFLWRNNRFEEVKLPLQAQFSMTTTVLADDFNKDGKTDLLLLGNHSDNRLKLGSIDASYGTLLTGDGKGTFNYTDQSTSGLSVTGDVKSAVEIKIKGVTYLILGTANEPIQFYQENK